MREVGLLHIRAEEVHLLPERAAWWPAERTLIVADLHLGKEHAYAALGVGLPGTILDETLGRLTRCIELTGARRVVIAGDLLHAKIGTTEALVQRVAAWRAGVRAELLLVPGNHDRDSRDIAGPWRIDHRDADLRIGPFRFVHEPDDGVPDAYTWAGHLHPGVRLAAGRDAVRLPCFCVGDRVAVLPAFTRFSGRMTAALGLADQAWAIAAERVFRVPTHAVSGS